MFLHCLLPLFFVSGIALIIDVFLESTHYAIWEMCKEFHVKLTFTQFETFYSLNPKKWRLKNGYPLRRYADGRWQKVGFSTYRDYYKFCSWLKKKNKIEDKMKAALRERIAMDQERVGMDKFIEAIQKDIEDLTKQANEEIADATEIVNGIMNNL